jgi:mannosyltransferase
VGSALSDATLFFDGIVFSLQRQGGISVYARQILGRLARDGVRAAVGLYEPVLAGPLELPALELRRSRARTFERYRRCDTGPPATLFHSSYYRLPLRTTLPSVVTVHDFAYERYVGGLAGWFNSAQIRAAIRPAQAIICISAATRDDLLDLVGVAPGQAVHVIHNGVDEVFGPLPAARSQSRPFVLFVGVRKRYKNFGFVLQAMSRMSEVELVCVGGGPLEAGELADIPHAIRQRIKHAGYVSDIELNRLYNRATCLVYPSRYEGFGIPVLEAMRAGCPVVSIACRAVVEVGGAALTVVPDGDADALATAVASLRDPAHRAAVMQRGFDLARAFSWEATYQATRAVYRDLGLA